MDKLQHILLITDFYAPHIGGVEKLFSSLNENLANNHSKVTCITWLYDKKLPKREHINQVEVIRVWAPGRLFFALFGLPTMIKHARKASLIHTSTYSAAVGAWVAAKITRKKVVVTIHEAWGKLWFSLPFLSRLEKRLFYLFEKGLLKLSFDTYIAVSDYTANCLKSLSVKSEKITRIYNGIDYNLPQWEDPVQPFTFTYFGRAGASKGLDIMIESFNHFHSLHPEINFKIILSPQSESVLKKVEKSIKNAHFSGSLTVLKSLSHEGLLGELLKTNCIVIPSISEGFGFTAAEASAMGIPVISSGKGALPEVISGKVITMHTYTPDGLIHAMKEAISGKFNEIPLKKFTIETFVKQHINLYRKMLS